MESATQGSSSLTTPVLKTKEECEGGAHKPLQARRSQIQSNSSAQGSATTERRMEVKRLHVFFCFFEDFLVLMWTILKVFVERVNISPLLLTFLFFGCEACEVLVPWTKDWNHALCSDSTDENSGNLINEMYYNSFLYYSLICHCTCLPLFCFQHLHTH